MNDARQIASQAAMQSFLNCYLRETGSGEWEADDTGIRVYCCLPVQGITIQAQVSYKSPTGRHVFHFPVRYRTEAAGEWIEADYLTLAALLVKELSLAHGTDTDTGELILRTIESCRNIEEFVRARMDDEDALYGCDTSFIEAEQSLLFGHLIHPTPKSRQGIPEGEKFRFSPELKGQFPLHYFRAHRSLVREDSALGQSAAELIKAELREDPLVDPEFRKRCCQADDYALIPVHPLQAEWLLCQPIVLEWIGKGLVEDCGRLGRPYMATSSLRTVYHPDSRFMYKFSIPVKVTNSLRVNKLKELLRGVEVKRLLETGIGEVRRRFPSFDVICDPAYITLKAEGAEESGFEVVLRDNPFRGEKGNQVTLIAALVQDALPGHVTRLAAIIRRLAKEEGRSTGEVSLNWFRRYLDISLVPMVWLYLTYGIALEAHQQNSVLQLKNGYPHRYFYRDNQGYYFCRSTRGLLEREFPGIGEKSQTVCDDAVADERFRYYLIFNHMFGLINGFGSAGLVDERLLLAELRATLEQFVPMNRAPSTFLHSLLTEEKLPCKANLLTRLYDMDELAGPLESQSVYVEVDNPLVKEVSPHVFLFH
ncbi:MAG: IucA/IucC family siderophore biosynthesis protein [Brevibacillus sp.]|nr:IucA/IucC family siderophore biosynthesis protein [Brevibacillus sp.]